MKINSIQNYLGGNVTKQPQQHKNNNNISAQNNNWNILPYSQPILKKQISFGRILSEHKSWGATLNKDGSTNFKLFTYPDAKAVYVEIINSKDEKEYKKVDERGIYVDRNANSEVTGIRKLDDKSQMHKLNNKGNGIFEIKNLPIKKDNAYYRFIIVKGNNDITIVKDPYAKEQPTILSWSKIHNPNNFKWTDDSWMASKNPNRITRTTKNGTQGVNSLRIYEMNIPTIVKDGDFSSAKKKLDEIKEKNFANAIEIMPVENTYSKQWGYDGVDKFAVNEKLGGSEGLKDFINYAHSLGLSVIMDMVPNHIGPDGDMLSKTGPYSTTNGPFGAKFNYEGDNNTYVRDFVANMALNWAGEYHVDGIRLDMTNPHLMGSDLALKQIVTEVHEHYPEVFLIAEDGANNREKITAPLKSSGSHERDLKDIDDDIRAIREYRFHDLKPLDAIGFDSEWDFPLMNGLVRITENPDETKLSDLDACIRNSSHRVAYSTSHDEIGNLDGTSSMVKYATKRLGLFNSIVSYSTTDAYQKAAHATYNLLKLYVTGELDSMPEAQYKKFISDNGITRNISKKEIIDTFDYASKKTKLALGSVYSIPGPKMYFQGIEDGRIDNFQFFRKLSDVDSPYQDARDRMAAMKASMDIEKGYDTDFETSYKTSTIGNVKPSRTAKTKMGKLSAFTTALNNLMQDNPALQNGQIINTTCYENEKVHGVHCKKDNNEIFAIKNYSDIAYGDFWINFPQGSWEEVINSDETKYSGSGEYINNKHRINSDGYNKSGIKIGDNSVAIFKRVG